MRFRNQVLYRVVSEPIRESCSQLGNFGGNSRIRFPKRFWGQFKKKVINEVALGQLENQVLNQEVLGAVRGSGSQSGSPVGSSRISFATT